MKEAKPYQLLPFNSFTVDKTTKIHFENLFIQDVFEKLLVHVCPICLLKPTFSSLQILKDHLRKEHEMFFCDLCVENLKVIFFHVINCLWGLMNNFALLKLIRYLVRKGEPIHAKN